MLAITVFIGGLSIYEVDQFVQHQTEDFINVTCKKDASQINDIFGDMEKSVHIMESYVLGLINSKADIEYPKCLYTNDVKNDRKAQHSKSIYFTYIENAGQI